MLSLKGYTLKKTNHWRAGRREWVSLNLSQKYIYCRAFCCSACSKFWVQILSLDRSWTLKSLSTPTTTENFSSRRVYLRGLKKEDFTFNKFVWPPKKIQPTKISDQKTFQPKKIWQIFSRLNAFLIKFFFQSKTFSVKKSFMTKIFVPTKFFSPPTYNFQSEHYIPLTC